MPSRKLKKTAGQNGFILFGLWSNIYSKYKNTIPIWFGDRFPWVKRVVCQTTNIVQISYVVMRLLERKNTLLIP